MIPEAPKYISQRLSSLNNYTWSYFFPGNSLNDKLKKVPTQKARTAELGRLREIINEASYILFVFLLNKFFQEGTEAAKKAVDTFGELDVDGFQLGSKFFSGRNENVMMGETLSNKLLESISDKELLNLILESQGASTILEAYRPFIERRGDA